MGKLRTFIMGEPPKVAANSTLADLVVSTRLANASSEQSALAVAAVFRARQMNADTLSALPLVGPDGRPIDLDLSDIVNEAVLAMQDNGEAYLHSAKRNGEDLEVLPTESVRVEWDDPMRKNRRIYKQAPSGSRYTADGMFRSLYVVPMNRGRSDLTGKGWMQSDRIQGVLAEQQYAQEYFENHGQPTGILKKQGTLTKKQAQEFRRAWMEAREIRGPAVMDSAMEWINTGFSANDSQWVDSHTAGIGDISTLAGIPGALLNYFMSGSNLTYANLSDLYIHYWRGTLSVTYASRIAKALSAILPIRVRFEPEELFKASLQTRADAASKLVYAGYEPDDVTDAVSLPPIRHTGQIPTTLQPEEPNA